ncbi:MAG TPA: PAS domain S-box protein [Rhizomicrobium sp.]
MSAISPIAVGEIPVEGLRGAVPHGSPAADSRVALVQGIGQALRQNDSYFLQLIQNIPVAIYSTDAEGRIVFYNEAAAHLWGRRPKLGEDWWCGSWRLFWPDGRPMAHDECPMAVTLKTGTAPTGVWAYAERPDGSRFPFIPYPTPLFDAEGKLIGAVNMLMDITEQKRGEEAVHRLAAIVESSDDAIVSKDLNGVIASWNSGAERLFGYSADEVIGKPVTILIPEERHDEEPGILARLRRGERVDHYETIRRRKDGTLIDVSLTVSPVRDAQGNIVGASKIARDITERKRAEERRALLMGELKHRTANLAAVITAIASQSRPKDSPVVDRFVDSLLGRIRNLLAVGELVVASNSRTPDLREVVRAALEPFLGTPPRIAIEGPSLTIPEQLASGLALAFHELATNAIKYGALSPDGGTVSVSWTVAPAQDGRRVEMLWQERDGPAVAAPAGSGFGSRVIRSALASARNGSVDLDYAAHGLKCRFAFELF